MTLNRYPSQKIEYRDGKRPVLCAEPGEVNVSLHTMETLAEVEDFIEALRKAAADARLPEKEEKAS